MDIIIQYLDRKEPCFLKVMNEISLLQKPLCLQQDLNRKLTIEEMQIANVWIKIKPSNQRQE